MQTASLFDVIPKTKMDLGDYLKDGIIYCGKCNTPKQKYIEFLGRLMPVMCTCQEQDKKSNDEKNRAIRKQQCIDDLRDLAFISKNMQKWRFDNPDTQETPEIQKCKKYVENFEHFFADGRGLLFIGNVGAGKTYAACCIANALIDKCKYVIVSNLSDISNQLFNTYDKEEYMYRFQNCALLVIDDFSMERDTQYMNEVIYNVIDTRYKAKKPLIVTTNLSVQHIKNPVKIENKRVYSRLLEMCIPIDVKGGDRRYKIATQKYHEDIKLLG